MSTGTFSAGGDVLREIADVDVVQASLVRRAHLRVAQDLIDDELLDNNGELAGIAVTFKVIGCASAPAGKARIVAPRRESVISVDPAVGAGNWCLSVKAKTRSTPHGGQRAERALHAERLRRADRNERGCGRDADRPQRRCQR